MSEVWSTDSDCVYGKKALLCEDAFMSWFQVALNILREEGVASFYKGLGPSLLGIAPYIAVNFCVFDLWASSSHDHYSLVSENTNRIYTSETWISSMGNQGEEVFAREVPKEDWNLSIDWFSVSYHCHSHVLSFGHG